jgi:hypothetical protein
MSSGPVDRMKATITLCIEINAKPQILERDYETTIDEVINDEGRTHDTVEAALNPGKTGYLRQRIIRRLNSRFLIHVTATEAPERRDAPLRTFI